MFSRIPSGNEQRETSVASLSTPTSTTIKHYTQVRTLINRSDKFENNKVAAKVGWHDNTNFTLRHSLHMKIEYCIIIDLKFSKIKLKLYSRKVNKIKNLTFIPKCKTYRKYKLNFL